MIRRILYSMIAIAFIAVLTTEVSAEWKPVGNKIKTKWAAKVTPENVWQEYPRPQMVRKNWQNLNGLWDYSISPIRGKGDKKGKILVPFCVESSLSGVGHILEGNQTLTYEREFEAKKKDNRLLLHFEAVDYHCEAFVNGKPVGSHKGGNTPFVFDITEAAVDGVNKIKVQVRDKTGGYQLKGKQIYRPRSIYYTRVSGIWQTVWLEIVPDTYIKRLKIDTTTEPATIKVKTIVGGTDLKTKVRVRAYFKKKKVKYIRIDGKV